MIKLLHIDDEGSMLLKTESALSNHKCYLNFEYNGTRDEKSFWKKFRANIPDSLILDIALGDDEYGGIKLLKQIREEGFEGPIIMCSGSINHDVIAMCMAQGADDFITKGSKEVELAFRITKCIERFQAGNNGKEPAIPRFIAGETLRKIYFRLPNILKSKIGSVLVTGESGTGKELVARLLQSNLPKSKPFITLNCSSFNGDLIESELFGHKKGAFTGAISDKKGIFDKADGGWVFLDEVARLSLKAQASLLRVLESGEVRGVGCNYAKKIDVKVLAATNENLESMVANNLFRRDLLERLKCYEIYLPPLRERTKPEVEEIVDFLICRLNSSTHPNENEGVEYRLENEVKKLLINSKWKKGNVRELWNTLLASSVEACNDGLIALPYLPKSFIESFSFKTNQYQAIKPPRLSDKLCNQKPSKPIGEIKGYLSFANKTVEKDFNDIIKRVSSMEQQESINFNSMMDLFEKFLLKYSISKHKVYAKAAASLELSRTTFDAKRTKYSLDRSFLN